MGPVRCRAPGDRRRVPRRPCARLGLVPLARGDGRRGNAVDACDLLVVVGTSSLVWPAAGLPERAVRAGAPVLEINPQATPLSSRATAHWPLTATAGLAQLRARLQRTPDDPQRVLAA